MAESGTHTTNPGRIYKHITSLGMTKVVRSQGYQNHKVAEKCIGASLVPITSFNFRFSVGSSLKQNVFVKNEMFNTGYTKLTALALFKIKFEEF